MGSCGCPRRTTSHNHVGSQHAGALFSAGEAASGGAFVGAFAEHMGAITPLARSAQIAYLKLAKGPITATGTWARTASRCSSASTRTARWSSRSTVELTDRDGQHVADDDRRLARAKRTREQSSRIAATCRVSLEFRSAGALAPGRCLTVAERRASSNRSAPRRPSVDMTPRTSRARARRSAPTPRCGLLARRVRDLVERDRLAVLDRHLRESQRASPRARARSHGSRPARPARPTRAPAGRGRASARPSCLCASARPRRTSATMPPRPRIAWAVMNASSSRCPRRTGKVPPW